MKASTILTAAKNVATGLLKTVVFLGSAADRAIIRAVNRSRNRL